MSRKAIFALAGAMIVTVGQAKAAIIESSTANFTSIGGSAVFDFSGAAQLAQINATGSKLVGIESYWTFTPGNGQAFPLDLTASLTVPPTSAGDNTPGFSIVLNSAGATSAMSSSYADTGLVYGPNIVSAVKAMGNLEGTPNAVGSSLTNLQAFFDNGGTIAGKLKLITVDPTTPGGGGGGGTGGGGQVPEPASMLVWGAVALGALARRRNAAKAAV